MEIKRAPLAVLGLLCACALCARDFPQPFETLDPLAAAPPGAPSFLPGGRAEIAWCPHWLARTDEDGFDVRGLGSFGLVDLDARFGLGLYWGSYLLAGPLGPGEKSPTIARWWMNAVQFEYGLAASLDLGRGLRALAEYSRASQHPLRDGYSQVTTDSVRAGLALSGLRWGGLEARARVSTGMVDLFGFWKSSVPKPRAYWATSPAAEARYALRDGVALFARAQADALSLRRGGMDVDLWAEAGLELGRGRSRSQVFLDFYRSGDTEEALPGPSPAALAGMGLRFFM